MDPKLIDSIASVRHSRSGMEHTALVISLVDGDRYALCEFATGGKFTAEYLRPAYDAEVDYYVTLRTKDYGLSLPLANNCIPRHGQRVIVSGGYVGASCTPTGDDGVYATFITADTNHAIFEGRTADRYFVPMDHTYRWRRDPIDD